MLNIGVQLGQCSGLVSGTRYTGHSFMFSCVRSPNW